jgi:hypothetical protein
VFSLKIVTSARGKGEDIRKIILKNSRCVYHGAETTSPNPAQGSTCKHQATRHAEIFREPKNQSPRSVYNKFENVMTFLNEINGALLALH